MKNPWRNPRKPDEAPDLVFIPYDKNDPKTWPKDETDCLVVYKEEGDIFALRYAFASFEFLYNGKNEYGFRRLKDGLCFQSEIPYKMDRVIAWQYLPQVCFKNKGSGADYSEYLTPDTIEYQKRRGWRE
jgi:hypothetical protein